jgi:hypothetical protein
MKRRNTISAVVVGALLAGASMFGADQKESSAEVELDP